MTDKDRTKPTRRFSDRVADYAKYRPGYPEALIPYLAERCALPPRAQVADIGSGTGIFTKMLLDAGFSVSAVEPNDEMRAHAEAVYTVENAFRSVNGSAEETTLPDRAFDLVVCAQAFHWFDVDKTRAEFARILKPDACAALIWNNRLTDVDGFARAYEILLGEKGSDYTEVNHAKQPVERFERFFRDGRFHLQKFHNRQDFDLDGLLGRAFSSSYVPARETQEGQGFARELEWIFARYAQNGRVAFVYQTLVYSGQI
ncbi:MAG: class I SAM-dependent methyltransferase [Mucilaginibacter polytrichastri]|nr:class I SAM-dependent methyltransferase [Mucilaginibacter polytrichastri]